MQRKETYSIEAVLSKVVLQTDQNRDVNFDGDFIHMDSQRYLLFKIKGTNCVGCGLVGTYFAKERSVDNEPYHFNLYGIDEDGREILMTKDHIKSKKHGGKNHISNYQPFCTKCQQEKEEIENRNNYGQFLTDVDKFEIYGFTISKVANNYYAITNKKMQFFTQDRFWEDFEVMSVVMSSGKLSHLFTLPTAIVIVRHLCHQIIYRPAIELEKMFNSTDKDKLFNANFKNVNMTLCITDNYISIYDAESNNDGHGEVQEAIQILKRDYKNKKIYSSVPLNNTMKHILDKLEIEYIRPVYRNTDA